MEQEVKPSTKQSYTKGLVLFSEGTTWIDRLMQSVGVRHCYKKSEFILISLTLLVGTETTVNFGFDIPNGDKLESQHYRLSLKSHPQAPAHP